LIVVTFIHYNLSSRDGLGDSDKTGKSQYRRDGHRDVDIKNQLQGKAETLL